MKEKTGRRLGRGDGREEGARKVWKVSILLFLSQESERKKGEGKRTERGEQGQGKEGEKARKKEGAGG